MTIPNPIRHCLIWGEGYEAHEYPRDLSEGLSTVFYLNSSRAGGGYKISREVLDLIGQRDDPWKAKLTTQLVDQRVEGDKAPLITREMVENIDHQPFLSGQERMIRLLRCIASLTDETDYKVSMGPDSPDGNTALAWSESTNYEKVNEFLDLSRKMGFLDGSLRGDGLFKGRLSVKGRGEIEEIAMTSDGLTQHEPDSTVPELPQHILDTYARLWQLETWLRRLVYVELKAFAGDKWASKIRNAEKPKEKDKRLSHMPIPEESPLSYAQLSELCRVLCKDWELFKPFLPPQSIWEAKLEEVTQIRHRIAHFRSVHRDDLGRVVQLLRDIDDGFQRFCTSYNDPRPVLPPSDDPVVEHFLPLDPFPWTLTGSGSWVRIGSADPQARLGVTVEVLRRPWVSWSTPVAGEQGLIYVVAISARPTRPNQAFDYQHFLKMTANLREHIIHVRLDDPTLFRVTIPALLGADESIRIIERVVTAARDCLESSYSQHSNNDLLKKLANEWPEYVLEPEDWLAFLAPGMPCYSLFGFEQS